MGIFSNIFRRERRSTDAAGTLESLVTNDYINSTTAMEIPAVGSVLNFIAGTITALPVKMYRTENGKSVEIEDDYRLNLLNRETGDLLDASQFKAALIKDYLLNGNGYAFVNWKGNRIESLNYVEAFHVSYYQNADPIFKTVEFMINGRKYRDYQILRMLRHTSNGINGKGLVDENQQFLSAMLSAIQYENKSVKTGGKRGFLKAERELSEDAMRALKRAWAKLNNSASSDTVMVLNSGLEFQDASITAVESQLNENKTNNTNQLYRIFGLSAAVMNGSATENEIRNAVRTAIMPVASALENALNRFCLLENEKNSVEFIIDLDELDTTSILTRYQAYEIAVRNGWMVLDEVRYAEGLNPLGLDFVKLGLDTVVYDPETKTMYTPNTKEEYGLNSGTAVGDPNAEGG